MIIKIAAFAVLIFMVYILFFRKTRSNNIKKDSQDTISDTMEQCPTCDVFVSKNESILSNGKYYCSNECLK